MTQKIVVQIENQDHAAVRGAIAVFYPAAEITIFEGLGSHVFCDVDDFETEDFPSDNLVWEAIKSVQNASSNAW